MKNECEEFPLASYLRPVFSFSPHDRFVSVLPWPIRFVPRIPSPLVDIPVGVSALAFSRAPEPHENVLCIKKERRTELNAHSARIVILIT